MRIAYADPPYLGCCKLYGHDHGSDGRCWNEPMTHGLLIERLIEEFPDGFALSGSSPSIPTLLSYLPVGVRMAPWVKPFASFKPNVNPGFTWEPVFWCGGRDRERYEPTVKDHLVEMDPALAELIVSLLEDDALVESITLKKGLTGAKPRRFAFWMFDLLGAEPTDELVDLFPGTGIVSDCWDEFCNTPRPVQEGMLA